MYFYDCLNDYLRHFLSFVQQKLFTKKIHFFAAPASSRLTH